MSLALAHRKAALLAPWNRNELWRRARAVPSLDLRFADNKSLVDATTGAQLVTFTRASSGTYVDSTGTIQRATTNLFLNSEALGSWGSGTRASVLSNTIAAPNGQLTADTLVEDNTASNTHEVINIAGVSFVAGLAYTLSVYAKVKERTQVTLFLPGAAFGSGTAQEVLFNLSTATTSTFTGSPTSSSIVLIGDGWYRCSVTASASTTTTGFPRFRLASGGTNSYTGDGTSGIYLWGAQLEQSSSVGEYVPTTSTINSAPRFDHNPVTGESLGLLVEEARTNLCLHNRTLTDAAWVKTNITAAKDQVGVTGGSNTASKITATAANGTILQTITSASAARATSAYVKRITGTGTVEMTQDNGSTWTAVTVTSDWTRVTIPSATVTNPVVGFRLVTDADAIAVDFVQLESGAFSTSAIETTTATATRSADVASISGSNFSSWYRQDEGTVFADARTNATHGGVNSFPRMAVFSDNTVDNSVDLYYRVLSAYTDTGHAIRVSNVIQSSHDANNERNGQRHALGWAVNNFAQIANGQILATDTSGSVPAVTQFEIGQRFATVRLNGTIRRLVYWGQRLPNDVLQAITQ